MFFPRQRLVAVRGTAVELRRAARLPGVRAAHMDAPIKLLLHESVPLVYGGSPEPTWSSGIDGRGGSVAVVDSGVDGTHPDLAGRMAANVKVLDPGDIFDSGEPVYLECPISCSTDTTGGHGTHVAGIVAADGGASEGYYRGVGPGAGLVGLGVGEGPSVLYAVGAFEWILANHDKYGIVAVNNSWGPTSDELALRRVGPRQRRDEGAHRRRAVRGVRGRQQRHRRADRSRGRLRLRHAARRRRRPRAERRLVQDQPVLRRAVGDLRGQRPQGRVRRRRARST